MMFFTPADISIFFAGNAGGANAADNNLQILYGFTDDLQRIDQGRIQDDGGSMLVVMEHRDVNSSRRRLLNLKASRRGDILQIDTAKRGSDRFDRRNDPFGILCIQTDWEGVHIRQPLEEHRLALHHRHGRIGANIAKSQDGSAVGDDGYGVALDGERKGFTRFFVDCHAYASNIRRIHAGEVVAVLDRRFQLGFNLSSKMEQEGPVR